MDQSDSLELTVLILPADAAVIIPKNRNFFKLVDANDPVGKYGADVAATIGVRNWRKAY
jgi:hypothetical protein